MKPTPRIVLLLLAFAFLSLHCHAADDDIITLDTLTVSSPRHQWSYARSAHFEILSAIDDTRFVSRVMQRAEQIISTFEKNNALFRMQRELPAKIIFISDQGIDRYLMIARKESLQHMRGKPLSDVDERRARFGHFRQSSARGFHNDEQVVFLEFMSQKYLNGSVLPFAERVCISALDLALPYLLKCIEIQTASGSALWLAAALNSLRGHTRDDNTGRLTHASGKYETLRTVDRWRLPHNFDSPIYNFHRHYFYRPPWFSIDDFEMSLGRYCFLCDFDLLSKASDFPRETDKNAGARDRKMWRNYTLAPNASLGAFLEAKPEAKKRAQRTVAEINASLIMQREARDFVYYCTFVADKKTRAAFARFVTSTGKRQPNESVFKEHFGMDYDAFRTRIYAFYKQLGKKDPDYKKNPWGPPEIVVAKFSAKDIPPAPEFRESRRSETTRIISDWFTLCGASDMARQTLLKTNDDSAEARGDPEFMAALGLNEAEHNRKFAAIALLERAMASKKVVRPEAWRTLARLRLENLLELKGKKHRLTKDELTTIIDPLAEAMAQGRESQQTYVQFAQVWTHTDVKPPKDYIDMLASCVRVWPENAELREAVEKIR